MPTATHRLQVEVAPSRREIVAAHLWAAGAVGVLFTADGVTAWFRHAGLDPEPVGVPRPAELAAERQRWSLEDDRDWQEEWKATIRPVRAGSTVIVPSWLADAHVAGDGELTLVLDPGRAFGSGHHATTTMCLEFIEAIADDDGLTGRRVADVGCGTGVLAIAAAARGATVEAVDVDPVAIEVTAANAARNDVVLHARTGSVQHLTAPADVVVANLVTDVVIGLAPDLVAAADHVLVVSGIGVDRADEAIAALQRAGGELIERRERDGWIAASLRCRPGPA